MTVALACGFGGSGVRGTEFLPGLHLRIDLDVCEAFPVKDRVFARDEDDRKITRRARTFGGVQGMACLVEPSVYAPAMRSDSPPTKESGGRLADDLLPLTPSSSRP